MASDKRPLYSPYGGSRESFDVQVEDETEDFVKLTGSINGSQGNDHRERSSSLISIVSVHHEDAAAPEDSDSDTEATRIDDSKPATKEDTQINLSLSSPSLKWLRRFLLFTFQWYPQNASFTCKAFCTTMQFVIVLILCSVYAFDMGAFHNRSLIQEELKETVTAAKNIIWSFRYLEMYILGVFYFRKRHFERMLSEVILTRRYWKKVRRTIFKTSVAVFLCVFALPVFFRVVQMNISTKKVESFDLKETAWTVSLSVFSRLVALPIFLIFIYVVYIIFSQVRLFKEQIRKWRGSKEEARNRFIDIKISILSAERAFQAFLLTHLLLLLILLIPAIFSCAERLRTESHYDQTYFDAAKLTAGMKTPQHPNNFVVIANNSNFQTQQLAIFLQLPDPPANKNTTQPKAPQKHTVSRTDIWGIVKIICNALGDFMEMLVLYSLPLVFLAKLHKIMTSLPEVVQDLKFTQQEKSGYLFRNEKILYAMKRDLVTGRGIQILRMDLTGVKAALLTLLMPFLTTTIHLLFLHVDLD